MGIAAFAWLATYAVHSTLLLLAAWAVTRLVRGDRAREVVWRVALLGGLATATLQTALPEQGSGLRWRLGSAPITRAEPAPAAALPADFAPAALVAGPVGAPAAVAAGVERAGTAPWVEWALIVWSLGAMTLLGSLLVGRRRLARGLRSRRTITSGELPALLEELRERSGHRRCVRLTVSEHLTAPIAMGVLRPEICVPPRALGLPRHLARAMLAHELGHHVRRDPLWLGLVRGVEATLFFQPLQRLARRRLAECAEFACDAWAVRLTADRVGLARCLAEVAGWLVVGAASLPACAMADLRSPLGRRVERILDGSRAPQRAPAWTRPIAVGLLGLTTSLAPGFAAPRAAAHAPPQLERGAPRLAEELERAWQRTCRELDRIEAEIQQLHHVSAERALSEETRERLRDALALAADLRARQSRMADLFAAWQTRPHHPER